MNIPNFITLIRVLLVPVLFLLLNKGWFGIALLVFISAAVTDALDGIFAKILNQKTTFGSYFDPLADKLLIDTAYLTLAFLYSLPVWLAVLVFSRDVIIVAGVIIFKLTEKPLEIKPEIDSKTATFLQMVTVCLFFELPELRKFMPFREYLVFFSAAFTLFSGFHYLYIGFQVLGKNENHTWKE
jgi:cardiolipin synthase